MLQKLSIQNYAIIDQLELDLSDQLNVITGETGAGKSIIIGALGLILGERADTTVLVDKSKKCIVEGVFSPGKKKAIQEFLSDNDFDPAVELVVRREIGINGKSRAFVNDTPVTLSQLGELSRLLVDLHQQFDTLEIGEHNFQRDVLDALAGHHTMAEQYIGVFREWQLATKEIEALKLQKQQLDKEADYNRFQFTELDEAAFKTDELEELEKELTLLNNSEGVKAALNKVYFDLEESEHPVVQQLKITLNQLSSYAGYHPELPSLLQRLQSAQIELQDIAGSIDRVNNQVNYDPEKIERLNDRLSRGYKLQKKHGVNSTRELLAIREELSEKLQAVSSMDDLIRQKEKEVEEIHSQATNIAVTLSKGRKKQVKSLEDKVNKLLMQVGMPNAKLKVDIQSAELSLSGVDAIEFLFDANLPVIDAGKAAKYQPVRKVASGGELSRLMLCIKSLVAQSIDLPTLIFDEIDTGVSGEAARQVGMIMKELAIKRQVICITHQPQIAGKANTHFFVYKEIIRDSVKTNIRLLSKEERITTIAKMLSGEKPTAAALENAKEMLMN